jgi:hypothetical protein
MTLTARAERCEQRLTIVDAAQDLERLPEQLAVSAAVEPAQARWIDVDDAHAVVHEDGPREVVACGGQTAQPELIQDHAQIAQAGGFSARQIDVTLTI